MWEHIKEMTKMAVQLKSLEVEVSQSSLVYSILNSLPIEYGNFKISYDIHMDKWSLNEFMTMCVQEGKLKHEEPESVDWVVHAKWKTKNDKYAQQFKKETQGVNQA